MNQGPDDALILPFDDPRLRALSRKHHGRTFFVSSCQAVDRGAWLADGRMWMNIEGTVEDLGCARPRFPENALSAVLTSRLYGLQVDEIRAALPVIAGLGDLA